MITYQAFCERLREKDKYSASTVELFVTSQFKDGKKSGTIRSQLSALRHFCERNSIPVTFYTPRLKMILKGVCRSNCAQPSAIRPKNAVRMNHLKRLCDSAKSVFDPMLASLVQSLFSMAFFGLLRPSEMCSARATPQHQLKRSAVHVRANYIKLTFSSFKHAKEEVSIYVQQQQSDVCPHRFLLRYLSQNTLNPDDLLFPCNTNDANKWLQQLVLSCKIKTKLTLHSFRRGGATWFSEQGVTDAKLAALGRWKSNAYRLYVKP